MHDFAGGLYAVQTLFDPFVDPFGRIPAGWKGLHEWVIGSTIAAAGNTSGWRSWWRGRMRAGGRI